jgi:hypothetical protein
MATTPPPSGIARVRRGAIRRRLSSVRTRLRRRQLDAALALGQDPWSTAELVLRAAQLTSLPARRRLADALEELVAVAQRRRAPAPYLRVRSGVVLERREALLVLAQCLREPAPVEVAVVARLALLAWDESSPVYVGGRHPAGVGETASRCLHRLGDLPEPA